MGAVWLAVRVAAGLVSLARGLRRLLDVEGSAAELDHVGFTSPRKVTLAVGGLQVVAGLMLVAGLLVPLAGGIVLGIALNAFAIRRRELSWHHPETVVDGFLLLSGAVLGFVAPGPVALDRILDWEVGGGAVGVFALVVGVLGGAAGTQLRDTRIVEARREGTETDDARGLDRPPVEPLDAETATDPAETTEGPSHRDPVAAIDGEREDGADDREEREVRERAPVQRELGDPVPDPLDPRVATDPGQATEGDSPRDPIAARDARNGRSDGDDA